MTEFEQRNQEMTTKMADDPAIKECSKAFFNAANTFEYSYHFTWLGRPIIQYPQDIVALQELIWKVKPQLIVETGVAHGGSLILSASILEIIGGDAQVVGVDIDIRPHNRAAIEEHPMFRRIKLIEGSSIDEAIVNQVRQLAHEKGPVLVILDSNHTHEHVLRELELYSPLVGKGSYLIVMDTVVEDMPPDVFTNRPWGPGDNPKTAVREFLKTNLRFEVDEPFEAKLLLTVAPEGYLKCIAD
jgi:cephalosporin hydroxylase